MLLRGHKMTAGCIQLLGQNDFILPYTALTTTRGTCIWPPITLYSCRSFITGVGVLECSFSLLSELKMPERWRHVVTWGAAAAIAAGVRMLLISLSRVFVSLSPPVLHMLVAAPNFLSPSSRLSFPTGTSSQSIYSDLAKRRSRSVVAAFSFSRERTNDASRLIASTNSAQWPSHTYTLHTQTADCPNHRRHYERVCSSTERKQGQTIEMKRNIRSIRRTYWSLYIRREFVMFSILIAGMCS